MTSPYEAYGGTAVLLSGKYLDAWCWCEAENHRGMVWPLPFFPWLCKFPYMYSTRYSAVCTLGQWKALSIAESMMFQRPSNFMCLLCHPPGHSFYSFRRSFYSFSAGIQITDMYLETKVSAGCLGLNTVNSFTGRRDGCDSWLGRYRTRTQACPALGPWSRFWRKRPGATERETAWEQG